MQLSVRLIRGHAIEKVNSIVLACKSDYSTLPPCSHQPKPLSDVPSYDEMLAIRGNHLQPISVSYYKKPLYIQQGSMQWLWDHRGERYLDLFGGIVTVSVGHCHPRVVQAAKQQMDRLWHTTSIYANPSIHKFAKKLTATLPESLKVVYFVNSGSEANDLALTMARLFTNKFEIIALRNAYHGASPFVVGCTALHTWRPNTPGSFGMLHTMNANPYNGVWGGHQCRDSPVQVKGRTCACTDAETCTAGLKYADQLQEVIQSSCQKQGPAAFLAESIQGVGGTVQFPRNFLREAYARVRATGGLCIADEVQTGFGRLGSHFWGFQAHGVLPDIVTMAKGIGNGFPLAAVVTTPAVASVMSQFLHFNTFGGNPIACEVGSAVLDVIEENALQANCDKVGTALLMGLAALRDKYALIGDVRGKGLMIGVEMVNPNQPSEPLDAVSMNWIWETLREHHILIGKGGLKGNVFRLKPPMCITMEDAHYTLEIFDHILADFMKKKQPAQ